MDAVSPYYLPVGVVRQRGSDAAALIVKVTFALGESGWAELARAQAPLSGDCFDGSGALTYPSDFQLQKRACDVVLVGAALAEPGPVQLRVGRMRKQSSTARGLGPRGRAISDAALAPEDQRLAFPPLPLEFSVEQSRGLFSGALPGPAPSAALVYGNAWHAPYRVELVLDGVLVDLRLARCFLTFRGGFRHAAATLDGLAVLVDPSGSGRVTPQSIGSWARYACQVGEPAPRREAAPPATPETPTSSLRTEGRTLPMSVIDTAVGNDLPRSPTISMSVVTEPIAGLPFTRSRAQTTPMSTRRDPSSALPFVSVQAGLAAAPASGKLDDDDNLRPAPSETVSLPRSPAAFLASPVLPFVKPPSPPAPPPSDSGLPFVKASPQEPVSSRRPVMMIGAIGTPLAYPPTPFANRGAATAPPAIVAAPARPSTPAIVAPPARPSTPAIVAPAPLPSAFAIVAPAAKVFDVPTYARGAHATGDANELSIPSGRGAPPVPAAPPVKRIQGLSLEELAAIRSELWEEPDSRRVVLRRHGLSELRWRVVERAWAAELETMLGNPDKVGEAVSRMRSGGRLRPSLPAVS